MINPALSSDSFSIKEHYSLAELREIMAFLRSDQGCPWDRRQTHDSIKKNLLEEAYETIDAIDSEQPERICDELGDVLMQIVFHAQMAAEKNEFSLDEVISGICRKLISRHTHIFGDDKADTPEEVLDTWEKNKKIEKGLQRQSQVLTDVPKTLPALQRSYKVQQKAAQIGFDWQNAEGPLNKIHEEIAEVGLCLQQSGLAVEQGDMTAEQAGRVISGEVGDLLFSVVNYARHLKVQPEMALTQSTEKFIRRFTTLEEKAEQLGLELDSMSLTEMDVLWEQVKAAE